MSAELVQLILVSICVLGLCVLVMAVGVIIKGKTFTSCACASIEYRGERIQCPACPEKSEDEVAECREKEESAPATVT